MDRMRNHNAQHTTIIKRSSRKGHEALHGGAWKVAFADFTLAMMALFMVLWIMSASSQQERQEIVRMINSRSFFTGTPLAFMDGKRKEAGKVMLVDGSTSSPTLTPNIAQLEGFLNSAAMPAFKPAMLQTSNKNAPPEQHKQHEQPSEIVSTHTTYEIDDLVRTIEEITSAYDAKANILIGVVPQGLRILITDDNAREMFRRGSAEIQPFFEKLLAAFTQPLNKINNKIIITGHTDSVLYRHQKSYNNWNLSGERALTARTVLTEHGLDEGRVLQVSGMADRMLLDASDPFASVNRRIEIMVLTNKASQEIETFFGRGGKTTKPLAMNKNSGALHNVGL